MRILLAIVAAGLLLNVAVAAVSGPRHGERSSFAATVRTEAPRSPAVGAVPSIGASGVLELAGAGGIVDQDRIALLLDAIVIWISSNFDLPAIFDHPEVRLASDRVLTEMRYGQVELAEGRQVMALYNDDSRVIYLSESWSSRSAAALSVLVHEMVHHLQLFGNHIYSCVGEREEIAYEAQERWLQQVGHSLLEDFEVDPLTLRVMAYCMH